LGVGIGSSSWVQWVDFFEEVFDLVEKSEEFMDGFIHDLASLVRVLVSCLGVLSECTIEWAWACSEKGICT
jgi:hypothetical protein